MNRALVLVAFLLFLCTAAWAQTAATAPPPAADPRVAAGGCQLPDLAGLTPEQIRAAALNAGLEVTFAATPAFPACPVTFLCNSLTDCAAGPVCGTRLIGTCCDSGGGTIFCCPDNGNIRVFKCPCKCAGPNCASTCLTSSNVTTLCV